LPTHSARGSWSILFAEKAVSWTQIDRDTSECPAGAEKTERARDGTLEELGQPAIRQS